VFRGYLGHCIELIRSIRCYRDALGTARALGGAKIGRSGRLARPPCRVWLNAIMHVQLHQHQHLHINNCRHGVNVRSW